MSEKLDFLETLKTRQTLLEKGCEDCEPPCESCSTPEAKVEAKAEAKVEEVEAKPEAKVEEVAKPEPKKSAKSKPAKRKPKNKTGEKVERKDDEFVVKPSETNRKFTQMIKERSASARKYLGRRTRY